jgi:hypothetical protein
MKSGEPKAMSTSDAQLTAEQLAEKLAEAVAEYYHQQAKEQDYDPEHLRLLYHDMCYNLQGERCPPDQKHLKNENELAGFLKEMSATREAARDLPNSLLNWWNSQPPKNRPQRNLWLEQARRLFQSCGAITDDS